MRHIRHTNCRAFINAHRDLLYFYCNAFFNYFYFDFSTSFSVDFVHFISIYILSDSPSGQRTAGEEREGVRRQGGRPGRLISLRSFLAFVVTRN